MSTEPQNADVMPTKQRSAQIARELLGEDSLLTPEDFAALVRMPVKWVYAQPVAKLPPRIQISERRWLYRASDTRAWLESRRIGGATR